MNPRHGPTPSFAAVAELPFLPWLDDAACIGEDPELWFGNHGKNETARAICLSCPLFFACTHWGITHAEDGMWGGLGEYARSRIRNARPVTVTTRYDLTNFHRTEAM